MVRRVLVVGVLQKSKLCEVLRVPGWLWALQLSQLAGGLIFYSGRRRTGGVWEQPLCALWRLRRGSAAQDSQGLFLVPSGSPVLPCFIFWLSAWGDLGCHSEELEESSGCCCVPDAMG